MHGAQRLAVLCTDNANERAATPSRGQPTATSHSDSAATELPATSESGREGASGQRVVHVYWMLGAQVAQVPSISSLDSRVCGCAGARTCASLRQGAQSTALVFSSVRSLKWQAEQKQQLGNETAQNGCHVTASLSRAPALQATANGPATTGKWQHHQQQEDEVPSQSSLEQCDPFKSILHMHTYPSCTPASPPPQTRAQASISGQL